MGLHETCPRERKGEKARGMSESGLSRLRDFQDIPNPVNPDSDNYFAQASLGRQAGVDRVGAGCV